MPVITGLTPITAAQNSWKHHTQDFLADTLGGTPVIKGDQYASIVLMMQGGETLAVKAVPTEDTSQVVGCSVDWSVDNVAQDLSLQYTTHDVEQVITVTIPGTGLRRVELFEQRCYITGLTPQTSAAVVLPTNVNSIWSLGASGSEAYYSYNPAHFAPGVSSFIWGWPGRLRTCGLWDAVYTNAFDGYGLSDHLGTTTPTDGAIDAYLASRGVPRVNGTNSQIILCEFGAGEYLNGIWSAAQIQTYYGMFADRAHAMFPSAQIVFKTMLPINSSPHVEGFANPAGVTPQADRDAVIAMASTRPWLALLHGYLNGTGGELQSVSQLQDGLHARPDAQAGIFDYDFAILSAYVTPAQSGRVLSIERVLDWVEEPNIYLFSLKNSASA